MISPGDVINSTDLVPGMIYEHQQNLIWEFPNPNHVSYERIKQGWRVLSPDDPRSQTHRAYSDYSASVVRVHRQAGSDDWVESGLYTAYVTGQAKDCIVLFNPVRPNPSVGALRIAAQTAAQLLREKHTLPQSAKVINILDQELSLWPTP